jgi:hypothetical protein
MYTKNSALMLQEEPTAELIFYKRINASGPREREERRAAVSNPIELQVYSLLYIKMKCKDV